MLIPCTIVYFSSEGVLMKSLSFLFILFLICDGYGLPSRAEALSTAQLPSDSVGTREADDSVRIIGNLPYSNQWTFERATNFLYLNYDQETLASQALHASHYESDYSANKISLISLDYFSKLFDLGNPLGNSFLRRFAFWGRYKMGFGILSGSVVDDSTSSILPAEKSSLLLLMGQVELNFAYDWSEWVQPYFGFSYKPYYYRNTSSMSSAELEGNSSVYGPSIGVHLPILFSHRGSLFAELHQDMANSGTSQLFATQLGADFGVGLVF